MMRSFWSAGLAALGAVLLASGSAQAQTPGTQSLSVLPDGTVGYTTAYNFSGGFFCGTNSHADGLGCASVANGIHLTSGNATLDLSFAGASGTMEVSSGGGTVTAGTVSAQFGGTDPFIFPQGWGGEVNYIFGFELSESNAGGKEYLVYSPAPSTIAHVNCCTDGSGFSEFTWPVAGGQPDGYHYREVYYEYPSFTVGPNSALTPLDVKVGITPEPSSLALLGTGLVGLVPFMRRRRS